MQRELVVVENKLYIECEWIHEKQSELIVACAECSRYRIKSIQILLDFIFYRGKILHFLNFDGTTIKSSHIWTVFLFIKGRNCMEFKNFGGQFVVGKVLAAVNEVEKAYEIFKNDKEFIAEYNNLLNIYVGRPSLLYYAKNMTDDLGGAKIYLKREDLNHTGTHKINNAIGQALLAKKWVKQN